MTDGSAAASSVDPAPDAAIVGVIGAGTMGAGIAQVAAQHGHRVRLCDVDRAAIERGRERVRTGLERRATRLEIDPASRGPWIESRLALVEPAATPEDAAAGAAFVIEAALEDLGVKQALFRRLDATADADTILATNTSALSVSDIADAADRAERVVGLHFFNPVPAMRLVEVVAGVATEASAVERAAALVRGWGKTPVWCADAPGFIVNRVNRPYTIEALRMLEAGEAGVEAIDQAMREAGFVMGPFEVMDLAGIDINLAAATGVWIGLGRPDRLRPSPIQEALVAGGRLGRKTGRGFYVHDDGGAVVDRAFVAGPSRLGADEIRRRILSAIGDEAIRARDEGVARESDIDLALRLGAAHPTGPFERPTTAEVRS